MSNLLHTVVSDAGRVGCAAARRRLALFTIAMMSAAMVLPRARAETQVITGPLRISAANPHYFADPQGRAVYLTGSHTWTNFQDGWTNSFNFVFDFNAYLDFLQQHNHNFIRLWRAEMPRFKYPGDAEYRYSAPHPWVQLQPVTPPAGATITGGQDPISSHAPHGSPPAPRPPAAANPDATNIIDPAAPGKFDLTQFNPVYFDRLRARCLAAQSRGIYVSVMLFEGHSLANTSEGWSSHPFNLANNINNIDGDPNHDGRGVETHTLATPAVTALQIAYVRKVIDTVNDLPNVLFEIANESVPESLAWQNHIIDFIHNYEMTKPLQHVVMLSTTLPSAGDALWQTAADAVAPPAAPTFADDPPIVARVIFADSDHIFGCGGSVTWIWKSFTRGLNVLYMDSYYDNTPFCTPPDESMRLNLGYTLSYASRMTLSQAHPRNDLASTRYCLAAAAGAGTQDESYLVFQPESSSQFTVDLTSTVGSFEVQWLNPATGAVQSIGTAAGGAIHSFTPPFAGPAVLFLSRATDGQ